MTTANSLNTTAPTNVLSAEELAPLMERKRQVQAELAANQHPSQAKTQGGCSSGAGTAPAPAAGQQPQVFKALLIAISILAVAALAWWAVTR